MIKFLLPIFCFISLNVFGQASNILADLVTDPSPFFVVSNAVVYVDTNSTVLVLTLSNSVNGQLSTINAKLTNLNYSSITNPPAIPSTNGFVNASITNGLLGANATNGFVNSSITNGLLPSFATNGYASTNYVITNINNSAVVLSNAFIGSILSVFTNQSVSLNTVYSNATGFEMGVQGLVVVFNEAALIGGRCSGKLVITGQNGFTNTFNTPTYSLLSGGSVTNLPSSFSVATNGTFSIVDTSTGAGNSISVVPFVQIVY